MIEKLKRLFYALWCGFRAGFLHTTVSAIIEEDARISKLFATQYQRLSEQHLREMAYAKKQYRDLYNLRTQQDKENSAKWERLEYLEDENEDLRERLRQLSMQRPPPTIGAKCR